MTWRPLRSEPPAAGTDIVVRSDETYPQDHAKAGEKVPWLDVCGSWTGGPGGQLMDPSGNPRPIPPTPEWLEVDIGPPGIQDMRDWFAGETLRLTTEEGRCKTPAASVLRPAGFVGLLVLMEEKDVGLDRLELGFWQTRATIQQWRASQRGQGGGWIKLQTDMGHKSPRVWFGRIRDE